MGHIAARLQLIKDWLSAWIKLGQQLNFYSPRVPLGINEDSISYDLKLLVTKEAGMDDEIAMNLRWFH